MCEMTSTNVSKESEIEKLMFDPENFVKETVEYQNLMRHIFGSATNTEAHNGELKTLSFSLLY